MVLEQGILMTGGLIEVGIMGNRRKFSVFDCELMGLYSRNMPKSIETVANDRDANVFLDLGFGLYSLLKVGDDYFKQVVDGETSKRGLV